MQKVFDGLIELIDSKQGENILALDVEEITSVANKIVIVTANSSVHANTLGNVIIDFLEENGLGNIYNRKPDLKNPWVLIDAGEIIINIFMEEEREFYNLEKLYFKGKVIYRSPAI